MRTPGASAEETSVRVRDAAVRLFARKGFVATGIRELAEEAGLTTSALYHYMGTKEDLLVDIMRSCLDPLLDAGRAVVADGGPPQAQLAGLVEMHVWFHASQPRRALVADSEIRSLTDARAEILQLRDDYEQLWTGVVAAGRDAGRFEVEDPRVASIALLEMCTGVSRWYRPDGRLGLEDLGAMHADLALGMVRAAVDGRPVRRSELSLAPPETRFGQS